MVLNAIARMGLTAIAAAVLLGGCRSNTDRIRVLEAEKAQAARNNQSLMEKNAELGSDLVEARSKAEEEEARRLAAETRAQLERERIAASRAAETIGDDSESGGSIDIEDLDFGPDAKVIRDGDGGARIVLASDITFRPGRADLNRSAESTLGKIVRTLKTNEDIGRVRIEGHTDSDPIRKSGWTSNEELSLERAKRVRIYLVSQGIEEDLMSVAGHGAARPIAQNDSATGKAKNRRVEIVLEPR